MIFHSSPSFSLAPSIQRAVGACVLLLGSVEAASAQALDAPAPVPQAPPVSTPGGAGSPSRSPTPPAAPPSVEGAAPQPPAPASAAPRLEGAASQPSAATQDGSASAALPRPNSTSELPAQVPAPASAAANEPPTPLREDAPAAASDTSALAKAKEAVKVGGGATLWYYQPTPSGQKNKVELYNLRLSVDADFGDGFSVHAEPRLRESKLRDFFGGTTWIEEGYASYTHGDHVLKLGKIYSKLGLFWDNSFWGNVQVYDGLKLAPDYGIAVEGKLELARHFSLGYAAQFFVVDGGTNVSLPARDTISIPDGRRRNEVVLRVDPTYRFSETGSVRGGLSGQRFEADAAGIPSDDQDVTRYGFDAQLALGSFGLWGEYLRQRGQSVTDYPIAGVPGTDDAAPVPGRAASRIHYVLAGVEYTLGRLTARYNFSAANYDDADVKEWMHVPALGFKVNDHLQLNAEYVHWTRSLSGEHEPYNRSFNLELFISL